MQRIFTTKKYMKHDGHKCRDYQIICYDSKAAIKAYVHVHVTLKESGGYNVLTQCARLHVYHA